MKKILKKLVIIGITIGCLLAIMSPTVFGYSIPEQYQPSNTPFALDFKNNPAETPEAPLILILQIIAASLLYVAAPLAVISIVMAAFTMVSSTGTPEKIETGKKHLKWAIIGLMIIIFSYAIVKAVITIAFETFNQQETTTENSTTPKSPEATNTLIEKYLA